MGKKQKPIERHRFPRITYSRTITDRVQTSEISLFPVSGLFNGRPVEGHDVIWEGRSLEVNGEILVRVVQHYPNRIQNEDIEIITRTYSVNTHGLDNEIERFWNQELG